MRSLLVMTSCRIHAIFNFPRPLILCRVWIGVTAKLDPEYVGLYIYVYILYGSRVRSASVIMTALMNLQLPVRSGSVGNSYVECGLRKCRYKRSNCFSILYGNIIVILTTSWEKCISSLAAAILDFRLPLISHNFIFSAIQSAILENIVCSFVISIPSCLQAQIHAFPV